MKTAKSRYGILMGIGIALQVVTRPYEGMLLCIPVAPLLGHWALFGKNRPAPGVFIRRAALPLLIVAAAAAWLQAITITAPLAKQPPSPTPQSDRHAICGGAVLCLAIPASRAAIQPRFNAALLSRC